MTTLAHETTWYIANNWETYFASAVLSGIVGDPAHQAKGGYHISIENNSSSNYSVTRPDDKAPPGTWPRNLAAAIDMSMSATDMKLCCDRLWGCWNNRANDPRTQYVNAFNGWFNEPNTPAKRYDFYSGQISETSSDHKWHVHLEIRRKWVTDMGAANAILSMLRGETIEQYLAGAGGTIMFCKFGDDSTVVQAMQILGMEAGGQLPQFGPDGGYGNETSAMVVALGIVGGDTSGQTYGPTEYAKLHALVAKKQAEAVLAAAGGGPGGLVPHTHGVPNLTVSVTGSGSTGSTNTGEAVAS